MFFTCLLGELTTLFQSWWIGFIIKFLLNENATTQEGLITIGVFVVAILLGQTVKSIYQMQGYYFALRMRKLLVAAIFDKVARLSAKSLAQTSSGKLITLVSADIFMIERGLMFLVFPWCSLIINISAMTLLIITAGWQYGLITMTIWSCTMLAQIYSAKFVKMYKVQESGINDNRLKFINDLVVGIRTIKASAWEHNYLKKVQALRDEQSKPLFKYNFVTSFGFILF